MHCAPVLYYAMPASSIGARPRPDYVLCLSASADTSRNANIAALSAASPITVACEKEYLEVGNRRKVAGA